MLDFLLNIVFFMACLYVGVIVGTYLKLEKYSVTKNKLFWSGYLFPFLIYQNILFILNKIKEPTSRQMSFYKKIQIFWGLGLLYFKFMPLFVAAIAVSLAKSETEMGNDKVPYINLFSNGANDLYNSIYRKYRPRYV